MQKIIVSRHAGAIEFIARQLAGKHHFEITPDSVIITRSNQYGGKQVEKIHVVATATEQDVADRVVYGNLPLDLASTAYEVWAVLFPPGQAPRGAEVTYDQMVAAGATLKGFIVGEIL